MKLHPLLRTIAFALFIAIFAQFAPVVSFANDPKENEPEYVYTGEEEPREPENTPEILNEEV